MIACYKVFEDSGGVERVIFLIMLTCSLVYFMVQSTETMWLRVLHCGLGLAYNWLFHTDVTAQHFWF